MTRLVLGTRGSDLARAQTSLVEQALRASHPELEIAIEIITTSGDEKRSASVPLASNAGTQAGRMRYADAAQGRKGMFTAEIELALVRREIDVAIHSAKDLPSEPTVDLEVCAALPRAPIEDMLITKGFAGLGALPNESTIATGSVRRQHQLRWARPDLKVVDLRGNVPTRLRKLIANSWDGIILARAGLQRLGFDCSREAIEFEGQLLRTSILPIEQFLPAGGQGVVALQIRRDDAGTRQLLANLNHAGTLLCLRAEREFLRLLQGDCGTPVGVLASMHQDSLTMRAQLFDEKRPDPRVATLPASGQTPETLAAELLELINGQQKS
ncbi:MAG: hydroxymethylbilane synthase [Verrucomicrobiota bacterium]|nr:hydroxymethylbilane synthase [Verrucomicrobiota bacterium]